MRDAALWARLCSHRMVLSDGRALDAALAAETGISPARAAVVVREYERFLYLVAATGLALAPSRAVDAAWHLHLSDSASYDDALCKGVLGRHIAHVAGGPAPLDDPAYAQTFRIYREEFGLRPPWRVWPSRREDRRATGAVILALAASGAAVLARYEGLGWASWALGGIAVLAALAYAAIAPFATANRVGTGCSGCVAGSGDTPPDAAAKNG